jgi:hypothetical protein
VSFNLNEMATEATEPLGSNDTFPGTSHDTSAWSYVRFRVLAASDQAGTAYIEQSSDGTHWFRTSETPVIADFAKAAIVAESQITMKYVRASYVNGAISQGEFFMATALLAFSEAPA